MAKYSIISTEKRQKLIKDVIELQLGVAKTARRLKIKLSTAKSILRAFRSKGKILRKENIRKKATPNTNKIQIEQCPQAALVDGPIELSQQIKIENIQPIQCTMDPLQYYYFNYFNWIQMMNSFGL